MSVWSQRKTIYLWGARLLVTAMALAGEVASVGDLSRFDTSVRFERAEWTRTYQEAGIPTSEIPGSAVAANVIVDEVGTVAASVVALFLVWLGGGRAGALWLALFVVGAFGGGTDFFDLLGYSSGSPLWASSLTFGWVFVALLGFVTTCPSPLQRHDLETVRRSAGRLARASGVFRFGLPSFALLSGEAATGLWLLVTIAMTVMPPRLGVSLFLGLTVILLAQASRLMFARNHVASPEDRGPLLIIRVAVLGFLAFGFAYVFESELRSRGVLLFDRFTPLLMSLLENALGLAVFLLLTAAVFVKGIVDPGLAVSRSVLYAALGLTLLFIFGGVETGLSDVFLSRIGAPTGLSAWLAGGTVALVFGPLRTVFKGRIHRWLEETASASALAGTPRETAVLAFSSIVGYSGLAEQDEDDALTMMSIFQRAARKAAKHERGKVVPTMGDGVLMEFADGVSALSAARTLHAAFLEDCTALSLPESNLRTGIHFGTVATRRDGEPFGDAVNIASGLEGIADPSQIVVSQAVADQLDGVELEDLGEQSLKSVPEPVRCWAVSV